MDRKFILISLMIVFQFYHFGFCTDANATDASLVSFSSGALIVEKAPGYDSKWDNIWIMDEDPKTGWCCPKGKILNNVSVVELAENGVAPIKQDTLLT